MAPHLAMTSASWSDMDAAPRFAAAALSLVLVPEEPGVYAWYRARERMYVGKADSLRDRVWGNHLGQGRGLTSSAFRRNVAEHLGFGSSAEIKSGAIELSDDQLADVRSWIMSSEVAWLTCVAKADAISLETKLKDEFKPPLTKI